ncbi:MAG: DUF4249 family protein [Bacteroidales bacterium]|nr:DUF4249 family protein [Bacteroidales bacterium]
MFKFCSYLLLCLLTFVACERATDLRVEGKGNVVVECILSEETTQTLRLSLTENASTELRNAVISLTDETEGNLVGFFSHQEGNLWELEYTARPRHSYMLTVEAEGFDQIVAHTTMPERLSVDYSIRLHDVSRFGLLDTLNNSDWELGVKFLIKSLPDGAVWIYGMNYDYSSGRFIPAQTIATSLESSDLFNLTGESYYNSYNPQSDSFFESIYGKEPEYIPPPGLTPGTVILGTRDTYMYYLPKEYRQSMYKYVVGCPLHDTYLRIPPVSENSQRTAADPEGFFSIAGSLQGSSIPSEPSSTDGYLMFVSVSEEYDRYLKDLLKEEARQASNKSFSDLFFRENISGNIEHGIGIFGAKTVQDLPWIKNNRFGDYKHFEW